ncbi:MAG: WD40/YVTN/BNR-like repeat-containing protein [Woeseiaceae bacterium]
MRISRPTAWNTIRAAWMLPFMLLSFSLFAQDDGNPFENFELRGIGPAVMGGRVSDFAFHPDRSQEFFAAHAVGGLWKTTNNAITWTSVFDKEGAYSIGVVTIDPTNPNIVWVGTGENNSQRSVAYGDGIYKSLDGGKSWTNMGLRQSEHISQIYVDPNDSLNVLVAVQGPLWSTGGDRGLYRTIDGGKNWSKILEVDEYTGVNDFVVNPKHPDHIIATSVQRGRHVWGIVGGGPGSAMYKTTDGGVSWRDVESGIPPGDKGRIGLGMAPSNPDIVYAIVFAEEDGSGFYRSTDFGETWEKRSDRMSNDAQYYNEITVDPKNADRVYSVDTFSWITEDGGLSWQRLGFDRRHVDDHAFWIDPAMTEHIYLGGDGGIYESWDRGQTWRHVRNLPLMQFYRVQPDNATPFYNVFGGTQDASTWGGPSRTLFMHGIANTDWRNVRGGDGFEPQIDPDDPNTVYAQSQHAGLVRYDWRTTERVSIVPQPASGENEFTWNWATPLIISPHDSQRLYIAAQKVFRSDDRGDNWRVVSPDLTRGIDRNRLPIMDRIWSVDALQKNGGVSRYGAAIALSESSLQEGLIYVGMDDGRINVTDDGGVNWRSIDRVSGVPDMTYVEDIVASQHDPDVAYATLDNHKRGDYRPYVYRTQNRGRSWQSISGDLPARGSAHTIVEDHVDPDLLIAGTEFGIFYTQNGGKNWLQLRGNFPTISVRDLEIQRRENDLVVGTYGRGIYILDDYSPLRTKVDAINASNVTLFPIKDALLYIVGDKWNAGQGIGDVGTSGAAFFNSPNPPFGAVFTYYLRDGLQSAREIRREEEKRVQREGGDNPYPSWEALRDEDTEEPVALNFTIRDSDGNVVRRIAAPYNKGLHRVSWDLRYAAPHPIELEKDTFRTPWADVPTGPLVLPGQYSVTITARANNTHQLLLPTEIFTVRELKLSPELAADRRSVLLFQRQAADLFRQVSGAVQATQEIELRLDALVQALIATPAETDELHGRLRDLRSHLLAVKILLQGDRTVQSRREAVPWSLQRRANSLLNNWRSQSPTTGTDREAFEIASAEYQAVGERIRQLTEQLRQFEADMNDSGAPWTPGRQVN